jgi:site-specific recombinase XerD
MNTQITPYHDLQPIIDIVIDGLTSQHSKDAYERSLREFLTWFDQAGRPGLSKATLQRYKNVLQDQGLAPATINLKLSAIRKMCYEAADNGLIEPSMVGGITRVKGVKSAGRRSGNWLPKDQAEALINSPDTSTLKGLRDRAILAVMIGTGLRRSEVANLTFEDVQQREGRWAIVDLVGKGNRVRSVAIPSWAKAAIDKWADAALFTTGHLFRPVHKGGYVNGGGMTPQAVHDVVKQYCQELGFDNVAPHDLRRTYGTLAVKGGASLKQIQISYGHASIQTTEAYLNIEQDFNDAPCDHLGLSPNGF